MTNKRKNKKQKKKADELAKQAKNLLINIPKQNDLAHESSLDIPPDAHKIVKTPNQQNSTHPVDSSGEVNFWEKWKFPILNFANIVGFLIGIISFFVTLSARNEAKSANEEATAANQQLQEAIIKIDSMTQITGTLTMKMAIVSGAIAKGDKLLTQQEREALIELANIINEKTPSARTAENWATLGLNIKTSEKFEDWERAIPYFEEAIRINDKYAEAYYNLGNIYKAKLAFNQASLNLPIFWEDFGKRTESESDAIKKQIRNNFLQTEKLYKAAIRFNPDYQFAYSELGGLYFEQGENYYQKALVCLREAVRLNPLSIYAHICIGLIYNDQGLSSQALEQFQKAVDIKEHDSFKEQAYYHMGNMYYSQDSFPQAINV